MTSINYLQQLNNYQLPFITTHSLRELLGIKSKRTLEDIIKRFIKIGILISLEKGKYLIEGKKLLNLK